MDEQRSATQLFEAFLAFDVTKRRRSKFTSVPIGVALALKSSWRDQEDSEEEEEQIDVGPHWSGSGWSGDQLEGVRRFRNARQFVGKTPYECRRWLYGKAKKTAEAPRKEAQANSAKLTMRKTMTRPVFLILIIAMVYYHITNIYQNVLLK